MLNALTGQAVLRLLPQLYWVVDEQAGLLQPFIAPENLFCYRATDRCRTPGVQVFGGAVQKKQPNLESSNFGRWSYIYLNLSKIMPS